jgi:hypothetical protein
MLLTKHEGETFHNQTVYISGQAFVRCTFVACTLLLRETVYYMEGCSFDRCNWHIDAILPWGSPDTLNAVQVVMNLVRQGQENLPAAPEGVVEGQGAASGGGEGPEGGPPGSSPFAP